MAKIVLSEAIQLGIKGNTKRKPKTGEKYKELVHEVSKKLTVPDA